MYNNLVFYFMRCEGKLAGGERGGPQTVIIRSLFGIFGAPNNGKKRGNKISWLSHTLVVFWPKWPMVRTGPSCFPSTPLPLWCLSSAGWSSGKVGAAGNQTCKTGGFLLKETCDIHGYTNILYICWPENRDETAKLDTDPNDVKKYGHQGPSCHNSSWCWCITPWYSILWGAKASLQVEKEGGAKLS